MKNYEKRRPRIGEIEAHKPAGEERGERGMAGRSRPPLARMLRIHEWLMENRYPNCRKIAEEFEVSCKTVQRDVNFMRDQMGLPIEYDKERFGFLYTRPVTGFPMARLTGEKIRRDPWRGGGPPLGDIPPLDQAQGRGVFARIGFDPESARAVVRGTWHPSQVIHARADGGIEMTLRARSEPELARWVLSWGGHAWAIEPARLRSRVREIAREILARH